MTAMVIYGIYIHIYIQYILVPRQAVLAICVSLNQLQPFAVSMIPSTQNIRDVIVTLHPNMIPAHMSDTKGVTQVCADLFHCSSLPDLTIIV